MHAAVPYHDDNQDAVGNIHSTCLLASKSAENMRQKLKSIFTVNEMERIKGRLAGGGTIESSDAEI